MLPDPTPSLPRGGATPLRKVSWNPHVWEPDFFSPTPGGGRCLVPGVPAHSGHPPGVGIGSRCPPTKRIFRRKRPYCLRRRGVCHSTQPEAGFLQGGRNALPPCLLTAPGICPPAGRQEPGTLAVDHNGTSHCLGQIRTPLTFPGWDPVCELRVTSHPSVYGMPQVNFLRGKPTAATPSSKISVPASKVTSCRASIIRCSSRLSISLKR